MTLMRLTRASRYYDIKPHTLREWIRTGRLSRHGGWGSLYIDIDEIEAMRFEIGAVYEIPAS